MKPLEALLENAPKLYLPVSKVIQTRMHANSDTHAQHMRVWQKDATSFTFIDALFKQIKGSVPGLWIRIRMDPHSFFLPDPDPAG